jgi:hypothetical protein
LIVVLGLAHVHGEDGRAIVGLTAVEKMHQRRMNRLPLVGEVALRFGERRRRFRWRRRRAGAAGQGQQHVIGGRGPGAPALGKNRSHDRSWEILQYSFIEIS